MPLLNVFVEPQLLNRLEDYRFQHGFAAHRAAAVRFPTSRELSPKPEFE